MCQQCAHRIHPGFNAAPQSQSAKKHLPGEHHGTAQSRRAPTRQAVGAPLSHPQGVTRAPRLAGERSRARHAGNVPAAGLWTGRTASPHARAPDEEGRLCPEGGAEGLNHGAGSSRALPGRISCCPTRSFGPRRRPGCSRMQEGCGRSSSRARCCRGSSWRDLSQPAQPAEEILHESICLHKKHSPLFFIFLPKIVKPQN